MLARFGCRWILAVIMTLIHLSLMGMVIGQESPTRKAIMAVSAPGDHFASLKAARPAPIPAESKTSPLVKADFVFNLPALSLGYLLVGLLRWHGDPALAAVSTAFIALMWFRIGRWVDDQRARTPVQSMKRSELRRATRIIVRNFAVVFLLIGLTGLTAYHHRTRGSDGLCVLTVLWSALYLIGSFWGAHRLRMKPAAA